MYCNYSKDKFDNQLIFIKPYWYTGKDLNDLGIKYSANSDSEVTFISSLEDSERRYFELLEVGMKPQQARQVLPNALKTEINMCGFISDWKHFFSLRSSHAGAKGMHPDMNYIANQVYDEFLKRKFLIK